MRCLEILIENMYKDVIKYSSAMIVGLENLYTPVCAMHDRLRAFRIAGRIPVILKQTCKCRLLISVRGTYRFYFEGEAGGVFLGELDFQRPNGRTRFQNTQSSCQIV